MTAEKNVQARRAKPVQGKPAWYGQYRTNSGGWRSVSSDYGRIAYASPEAALTAATDAGGAASEHEVVIVERGTDKAVKSFDANSKRYAEKLANGIAVNLDHRRYYVDVRPRSVSK